MSYRTRWPVHALLLTAAIACGDDDDDAAVADASKAGRGGSHAGDASTRAGSGARDGSTSTGSSATGGRSGTGGRSDSGARGGSGGSGGTGGTAGDDAGVDAGTDSGMPVTTATVCKAPVVATNAGNTCPSGGPPAIKLTLLKDGYFVPVFVTQAPDDDPRLFVVERGGLISRLDPADGSTSEFIRVPNVASGAGLESEEGLLGLAFHPDFPRDPRFFVYYYMLPPPGGAKNRISAFKLMADDPDKGDPASEEILLDYVDPEGNHNGGMLAFGPDGCLFVAAGDGGGGDDMHGTIGNGQALDTNLGKILRLDVDAPTMGAPGNLPGAANPHIWDYGMRNPWRFSFDRMTGDLYIGDVGQGAWEEVDVEAKGDGHKNYGWKIMEGTHCRPGGTDPCDMNGLTLPISDYPHGNGDDCIIGGYVYRGSAIDGLQGWYLYGDNGFSNFGGRRIRALVWDGTTSCQSTPPVLTELNGIQLPADITSFGQDRAGELYVTTSTAVYRIDKQ